MSKIYDVIVLGAGPAGFSAGLAQEKPPFRSDSSRKRQTADRSRSQMRSRNYPGQIVVAESPDPSLDRQGHSRQRSSAQSVYLTLSKR